MTPRRYLAGVSIRGILAVAVLAACLATIFVPILWRATWYDLLVLSAALVVTAGIVWAIHAIVEEFTQ